ncbi:MAG: hypothetical protein AAF589_02105 [Planctomycetota bacterium]
MNFDNTHIAIRERNFAEVMDLALHVTRAHAGPLLLALLAGATPWALLNAAMLAGSGMLEDLEWDGPVPYGFWMTMLVAIEAPLATAGITLYLGQVTFADRVEPGRIVRDYFRALPQMLWSQGVVRLLCAPIIVTMLLPYASWPYLSELILLERNPLFAGKQKRLTTRRRSKHLHGGAGGDLFTRWIVSLIAGSLMILSIGGGIHVLFHQLFNLPFSTITDLTVTFPLAMWLVVGFFAVVRFLAYLDLRIRREGWEVELTMRAEAERLARLA